MNGNDIFRVMYDSTPTMAKRTPPASSEKSILMNALAMKYLPIERPAQTTTAMSTPMLNEMTPKRPSPTLTNSTGNNRSPSDLSIASYKYLEKYGLL